MAAVRRIGLVCLLVLLVPATAVAVRGHASPTASGFYRGSDSEGPVSFSLLLATDTAFAGRPAYWTYSVSGFRFATECEPHGVALPDKVTMQITRHHPLRVLHFSYRSADIGIRLTLSGKYFSHARGTVRISTRRCDGDALPFTASLANH